MPPQSSSRRALLLAGTGTLSLSVFAGCLSDSDDDSSPEDTGSTPADEEEPSGPDEDDDGDGGDEDLKSDDDDETTDDTAETDANPEYEVERYQHSATGDESDASLLTDRDDLETWLDERTLEGDGLESLLEDVDFGTETVVALEVDVPTPCHELELDRLAIGDEPEGDGDETLELEASVHETGDDMCSQVITTIGLLVRVSVASDSIAGLSVGIVDTDGSEYGVGTASASDSGGDR